MGTDTELVQISQGLLLGRKTTTKSGGPLICFQGIPYAKPPVGSLRFKPPQPPDPWNGIFKALEEPPICPQISSGIFLGQEDCLYLNVYTQCIKTQNLKPVMFWIHSGGFVNGSGNTDMYGPDYLVDAGVVLVTFNFRLGVLGFLNFENKDVSGNMGMKDQVLALCWVQHNIKSFGGDPNNITIFGESAGGASVNYHMLSPMTKGLFHKAIAQSGSSLNPYAFTIESRYQSFRLGELLGLKTKDQKELYNFLLKANVEKLVQASGDVISRIENTSGMKIVFVPSLEPIVPGQKAYLTQHPNILLRNGQFHHVPYITGTVTHEGMVNLRAAIKNPSVLNELNEKFENVIPRLLRVGRTNTQIEEMSQKLRKFYFNNGPLSVDTISSYVDLNTDGQIATGVYRAAKYLATTSSCPVYFYNFTFDGELGCAKKSMGPRGEIVSGPYHADDLGYLFRLGLYDPDLDPDSMEVKMRGKMVTLWTNFAKTGNPTPYHTPQIPIEWQPFTISEEKYLIIDKELKMDAYLRRERMAFWEEITRNSSSKL